MGNKPLTLIVISFYDRRPIASLENLLKSMQEYDAGEEYSICIVVNQTSDKELLLASTDIPLSILYRNNTGMNIGAWDHGWRENPDFSHYLFLQDECYITKDGWVSEFKNIAQNSSIGLIGESHNKSWDQPWDVLKEIQKNVILPDHEIDGVTSNRVDVYMNFMKNHSIPVGLTGSHLRSLVWFLSKDVLEQIDGFPIGSNYGECIAAEIGVSRKIISVGLDVVQIKKEPFNFIRHLEWNQDHPAAAFTHKSSINAQIKKIEMKNNELLNIIQNPSWTLILKMILNRLKPSFLTANRKLRK